MASATDATSRTVIMRLALERAAIHYGTDFDYVVAVGDAPWDARAASELQWPLIGISSGGVRLSGVHEEALLADLMDREALDRALGVAAVPKVVCGESSFMSARPADGPSC